MVLITLQMAMNATVQVVQDWLKYYNDRKPFVEDHFAWKYYHSIVRPLIIWEIPLKFNPVLVLWHASLFYFELQGKLPLWYPL